MRITVQTDYAIRMVDYLVQEQPKLISSVTLSEETGVPLRFAKNILQILANAGIIQSYHGVYGGYGLSREPDEITLYDIVEAIQGPIVLSRGLNENQENTTSLDKLYPYNKFFKELSSEMESKLKKVNFGLSNPKI